MREVRENGRVSRPFAPGFAPAYIASMQQQQQRAEEARILAVNARAFLRAATILDAADAWLAYVPHTALCQSIELALKALLLLRGAFSKSQLKDGFGHDLQRLLGACGQRKLDLGGGVKDLCWVVDVFSGPYKDRDLHYLELGVLRVVPVDLALGAAQQLVGAVMRQCNEALGLGPDAGP